MEQNNISKDYSGIKNISEYLKINSEMHPDKPALLYPQMVTYREMEEEVRRLAIRLKNSGITNGTITLVMLPAGKDFFILIFALIRISAVPVMIDPGMGIKAMITVLADLKPEAFIGTPKAHLLRIAFPHVFKTVKIKFTTGAVSIPGTKKLNDRVKDNTGQNPIYPGVPDDMAAIFFTSGSTGPAKGVIYTSAMFKNQIEITRTLFKIGPDETDLCTFPLLGLFAICHGNSSVLADMDMLHPVNLDPARVIKNIFDFNCTQMFGSPMVLKKLGEYGSKKGIKLPSLRKIISAGAPIHMNVLESFSKLISENAEIHTAYGSTEALPVTDITASEIFRVCSDKPENESGICIGNTVERLEVRIIEITDKQIKSWDDARPMPVDEVGEIVVKGPWISTGYFRQHQADILSRINDHITKESWYRMGDLGKIDSYGKLWFYGRKSHRIITSAGTLFTIPCEAVFNRHSSVARSALVGVPGERSVLKKPVICIQLKPGFYPTEKLIRELLELGNSAPVTKGISDILFKKDFPVDPRHNAKIFREKFALWAARKIK